MEINMFIFYFNNIIFCVIPSRFSFLHADGNQRNFGRVWNWLKRRIYLSIFESVVAVLATHDTMLINYSFDTFGNCMNNLRRFWRVQFGLETIGNSLSDSRLAQIVADFLANCFRGWWKVAILTAIGWRRDWFKCHASPPSSVAFQNK